MTDTHTIRVIAFCEGDKWVAQCLEYDIGAQADNLDSLRTLFSVVLRAEIAESVAQNGVPFAGIPAAPARFEELWAKQSSFFKAASLTSDQVGVDFALAA